MQKKLVFTWQIVPLGQMKFPPQGLGSSIIIITPKKEFDHSLFYTFYRPTVSLTEVY